MTYRAEIEIAVKGANQLSSFQGKLNASALAVDNLNKFLEAFADNGEGISRSISNLNRQLQAAATNFNEVALGTKEAETAAVNYLTATNNLNNGLRERANLLAEVAENERKAKLAAAGIKETTQFSGPIGPGQATTFGTGQEFVGQLASSPVAGRIQRALEGRKDELELQRALQALDQRGVSALEEKLNIQTKITNSVSLQAQRAKDAQLQGQSLRIPTPFRTAGSMGFPVALPEIEQDRKIRERAQAQESAKRALNLQKSNSLLTQGVTNLKLQVVVAQQLGGVYEGIVKSLKTANERQSKLFRARSNRQQRQELGQENVERVKRINQLAGNRVLQESLKNKAYQVGAKLRNNEFNQAKQLGAEIDNLIKAEDARIDRARRILKFRQKERAEIRAAAKERGRRRRDAASNALIGGAFPLLFGQGAGAALGGGLGGGLGGLAGGQFGFGLSLVGTAAGQAIDTLIAKAADLGKALDKTSLDIEAVTKAAGEVSKQAQTLIEETKEVAGAEEAAAAAASLLATQIGQDGVTALRNFADANKELDASVAVLISNLSVLGATLLGPVVKGVAGLVERANLAQQVQTIRQEGGPDAERLRAAFERGAAEGGTVDAGNLAQQQEAAAIIAERRQEILDKVEQTNLENSKALPIAEKEGEMLKLKGGLLNENIYLKKKEIIELEYEGKLNQENLTPLQEKILKQEKSNALQKLSNDRAAEAARAAEKANRAEEKAQRQRKQRENQLLSAQAAEKAAANSLMRVDLQKTKVFDGDLAALRQRETQLREELNNNLKILEVRQKQRVQNVKSLEEAKVLHEAYLLQYRALVSQEETETAIVGLAIKRLELSRQQEKIDADRARRSQIEGIRQESFGFTAQLADPFNLNPERVIAAESELRASQLLRAEREKLADLERERTIITPFASTEALDTLKDQIDAQKAFIPQLEAELALRNQLELAAARQSVIIEKYGFLANELSTAMTSAVQAVVTGTSTVEEAFSTMFANIGKAFIDMATQMLAQKLFMTVLGALSGGGAATGINPSGAFNIGLAAGRASGGPVSPGSTYLVGERGPELLTMGPSGGYVTSNSASQAAMDRYSGGNARGGSISVNYNVTDINGMRFVTEDQFREGVAQAAKQGADGGFNRTMSSLKNNRSTRSRVGI